MSIVEQGLKLIRDGGSISDAQARAEPTFASVGDAQATGRRRVHVDREALIAGGFLPPDHMQAQIAAQFRHAKHPLLAAALGRGREPLRNGRLIMVTSALPDEGKTFVSVNLALSLALERDISVVLVDADVAKAHVSRLFGIEDEPGLLEAVKDESFDVDSLILPTSVPKLSILPAGKPTDVSTELLASLRMESVLANIAGWADRKRVLVFDSPPLLLTSESRVLAQLMGQIVIVVRAEVTAHQVVFDAIDCLGDEQPVSLILNQSTVARESGYDYRYGPYGGHGGATDRRQQADNS